MLAIDTNVFVRLIAKDDATQLRHAMERTMKGAWVSHLVLAESVWVLTTHYALSRSEVAAALDTLLEHSGVAFEERNVVRAALQTYRQRRAIDFSDCLILEIARKAGHSPLGTFDRALAKLDGVELVA